MDPVDEAKALAEAVWAQLAERSEQFRSDFIDQLGEHMCTNCGGSGPYCCYDSRQEYDYT